MTKPSSPALPMPFAGRQGGAKFSRSEWDAYRRRRAQHLLHHPDYDVQWQRPEPATADAAWKLLAPRLKVTTEQLLPAIPLAPDEITEVEVAVKQALTVAVDTVLSAGEPGRMLTTNLVFDALAGRWSDHYRRVVETGPATISYDMKAETIRSSWRDLIRNGIRLETPRAGKKAMLVRRGLWEIVSRGCPDLYATERISTKGYVVTLCPSNGEIIRECRRIIAADPVYRHRGSGRRLLLDDPDPIPVRQEVAGEWAYNVVTVGANGKRLLEQLGDAKIAFHVDAFLEDVERLDREAAQIQEQLLREYGVDVTLSQVKPRGRYKRSAIQWGMKHIRQADVPAVKVLVERYNQVNGALAQVGDVYEQVHRLNEAGEIEDGLLIRSGFFRAINRRVHPVNFWPVEVTGKDERDVDVPLGSDDDGNDITGTETTSRRGRWFGAPAAWGQPQAADPGDFSDRGGWNDFQPEPRWAEEAVHPLVGRDVSSSQLQILSIVLGLESLEAEVTRRPAKETLAERAWERAQDPADPFILEPGFDGPDDKLKEAVKKAVMLPMYGSELRQVAYVLQQSPEAYGPGLGDRANIGQLLFDRATGLAEVMDFLGACREAARRAVRKGKYAGLIFTDVFDRTPMRWNPVKRRPRQVSSGKTKVYMDLPAGMPRRGEYPVDEKALADMAAPCLVHMLDAAFAGHVVQALHDRGVKDVVSVHDSWMVARGAEPALLEAIEAAGEPWLRSLGPLYDDLLRYLAKDKVYGPKVALWKARWGQRVAERRWPKFLTAEPTLAEGDLI